MKLATFFIAATSTVQASWDKCEEIRKCADDENPWASDCFFSNSNPAGPNTFHTNVEYPFLRENDRFQTNSAVWIVVNDGAQFDFTETTLDGRCNSNNVQDQHFCWTIVRRGFREYKFNRGSNFANTVLDTVNIGMRNTYTDETLPSEVIAERMLICDGDVHSFPSGDSPTDEPPTTEPPATCTIDDIDAAMDAQDLIDAGMKKGKAARTVKFWAEQIIGKFKDHYNNSKFESCRHAGEFDCDALKMPSNDHREMFDWANALFAERLGACGGYRQLDKKLQKWAQLVNLGEPELKGSDCPDRCHHTDFQYYLLPRINYATENSGFTKKSHKNKFKYFYTKWMSIIQNEYRESEECQASVAVSNQQTFNCLTVCLATDTESLMGFYFARLGDSVYRRPGCANRQTHPPPKQPPVMKQMEGLNNWLFHALPDHNAARSGKTGDFWLPKWAENL